MKLSKKIAIIFIFSTLMTIGLYKISSDIMINSSYSEEVSRMKGIIANSITQINREVDKVIWRSNDYISYSETLYNFQSKYGDSGGEDLGIVDKLVSDTIDYKVYFDKNMNVKEKFKGVNANTTDDEEIEYLIEQLVEYSKNYEEIKFAGYISSESSPYIMTMNPIIGEGGNVVGYLAVFKSMGDSYIDALAIDTNRAMTLVTEIDKDGEVSESKLDNGAKVTLVAKKDTINSYYKIPLINDNKNYYIKISEPYVVRADQEKSSLIFFGVQIIISLAINIFIYRVIERVVVRRIQKLNEGINNINTSKSLNTRIDGIEGNDEISKLSKDINNMFDTLETSNEIISKNEKKYSKLLDSLTNGFAYLKILDEENEEKIDAEIIEANEAFCELVSSKCIKVGERNYNLKIKKFVDRYPVIEEILDSIHKGDTKFMKEAVKFGNRWVDVASYRIEKGYFALVMTDITESKNYAENMRYLANYDVLTGLPNRYSLFNYMGQLKYEKKEFTIFFIDLDNFKTLNDTLGHNSGDEVLCEAANSLRQLGFENLNIGRLGGDEFLIIKEGITLDEDIESIGNAILNALNKTYYYSNYTYELKSSVGVSSSPKHASDIETLIKYADIAMYRSKRGGGNKVQVFSDDMLEEIIIETELKNGLENKEFVPYYQPIYSVENDIVVGAEALVRWISEGKVIQPYKFIPIAKKTGFISEIDNFILEEACKFCKEKREALFKDFEISVNASYRFLKQPDLIERLETVLKKNGLPPSALKLEITEDEVLDNPSYIISILSSIRSMGVKVALDDFGVGYSSFNHIKMLPIDTIKIDRSLLLSVEEDNKTLAIINTLIKLSHTLDLDVVCEGVEINDQLELLKKLKCDKIQGFLISKPISKNEFNNFLKDK